MNLSKHHLLRTVCFVFVVAILYIGYHLVSGEKFHPGSEIFSAKCAQCHGSEAEGFRNLYPALADSAYLADDIFELPCIIRRGIRGTIQTGRGTFNQLMPPLSGITNTEMAHLITYLHLRWGNKTTRGPITSETITLWLSKCP